MTLHACHVRRRIHDFACMSCEEEDTCQEVNVWKRIFGRVMNAARKADRTTGDPVIRSAFRAAFIARRKNAISHTKTGVRDRGKDSGRQSKTQKV